MQLALRYLFSTVKANPTNDSDIETWSDDMALSLYTFYGTGAVLQKVYFTITEHSIANKVMNIKSNTSYYRFGYLLIMSIPARNV